MPPGIIADATRFTTHTEETSIYCDDREPHQMRLIYAPVLVVGGLPDTGQEWDSVVIDVATQCR